MTTPTTNHTITLYPTLVKRLVERGWQLINSHDPYGEWTYLKRRGNYTYIVDISDATNRATLSRYERLSG